MRSVPQYNLYTFKTRKKSIFHSDTYENIHKSQKNRKAKEEFKRIRNDK